MDAFEIYFDVNRNRYVFGYDGIDATNLVYMCTASLQDIQNEIRLRCYSGKMSFEFEELALEQLWDIEEVFQNSQALLNSVAKGNEIETERLLREGADPNFQAPDGKFALMIAARHGHESRFGVVELLVEAGACLDSIDENDLTALDYANEIASEESWSPYIAEFLQEKMAAQRPLVDVLENANLRAEGSRDVGEKEYEKER